MNLSLGLTQKIIQECKDRGVLRNQCAYILATAYWETAKTMEPVKEAFWKSEGWRKKNLTRYYPYYGRGLVQLTWKHNYEWATKKFGPNFVKNPSLALDPEWAVQILIVGMMEGQFGRKLTDFVTLEKSDFAGARRSVNVMDKAWTIAEIAKDYDKALLQLGYGVEQKPKPSDERRDGSQPRESLSESTTLRGVAAAAVGALSSLVASFGALDPVAQLVLVVSGILMVGGLAWIARERIKKWARGER